MLKIKFVLSICVFSILLGVTSTVKNKTRVIEKKISKIDRKLIAVKKDLHETELDFYYLSSPSNLSKKVKELALIEYVSMDFYKIYLNFIEFTNSQNKLTNLKIKHEKKLQKK